MNKPKERIDLLLVRLGFFDTREMAKRVIMAGMVLVNEELIDKPGTKVPIDVTVRLKSEMTRYVGRGGYKLEHALKKFDLDLTAKTIIDVGASTGGFTDCALQNGAQLVYAIDVGYNQLAWKLRQDDRVICLERVNFRYMKRDELKHGIPTFACMDVSFISIKLLLPVLKEMLADHGEIVALIKPQFEAGREFVNKGGIVKEAKVHLTVIKEMVKFIDELGLVLRGLTYSPIKGGSGNIEFLMHIGTTGNHQITKLQIEAVVKEAHQTL